MEIGFELTGVFVHVRIVVLLDLLCYLVLLALAEVWNLLDLAHESVHAIFVVEFCM